RDRDPLFLAATEGYSAFAYYRFKFLGKSHNIIVNPSLPRRLLHFKRTRIGTWTSERNISSYSVAEKKHVLRHYTTIFSEKMKVVFFNVSPVNQYFACACIILPREKV